MKIPNALNVFLTLDKNYLVQFTVTLTSLLENNKDLDIEVYVIHDLDDASLTDNVLVFFKENYKAKVNMIKVDNAIFANLRVDNYITKATYFRLLLADIIPATVDSGLYLDCDIVVTGSLKELALMGFQKDGTNEEYGLMAISDKNEDIEIERFKKLGINTKMYFNAGVLLVNLKQWRASNISEKLIHIADKYKQHLDWHDQDVLNMFFIGTCGRLDTKYNIYLEEKVKEMPLIMHYSGSSKPWHYYNHHPYKSLFWKYLKLTPFKKEKFEKITINMVMMKYYQKNKRYMNSIFNK